MDDLESLVEFQGQAPAVTPVNRWKALEDMVQAETNPLALFLLTPQQDLEEQVKYCDYLLWRYLAYEAKLEQFVAEREREAEEFENAHVRWLCNQTDPGTNKFYTNAYATRLAATELKSVQPRANALLAQRKLRLVKAYVRALLSKSNKLPGRQGQANQHLRLEMDV